MNSPSDVALDERCDAGDPVRYFAAAAFSLGQAIQVNDGALHPGALAWLFIAMVLLAFPLCGRRLKMLDRMPFAGLCAGMVAIQWMQLTAWGLRWLPGSALELGVFAGGMCIAALGVMVLLRFPQKPRLAIALLITGHLLAAQHAIRAKPNPPIDVWQFQQASTDAFLHGENPYRVRYRNLDLDPTHYAAGMVVDGWMTTSYPYTPMTVIATAPAQWLLGDVRWTYAIALELAAALIAALAIQTGMRALGGWATALMLLTPRSLLLIAWGWTEPLVVLVLAGTVYCALRKPRWLWLMLGLLMASKQYSILFLPLTPLLFGSPTPWRKTLKTLAMASVVAACITIPFILWDPHAFLSSAVFMQIRQPFRIDALSFTAMFAVVTGVHITALAGFAAAGGAVILSMRRIEWSPAGFIAAAAIVLLSFFAFNKQAFCNYYFLVLACCCLAVATRARMLAPVPQLSRQAVQQRRRPPRSQAQRAAEALC